MSRVLTIGMLMILAAVAGFYARDYRRYNEMDEPHFAFPHRVEDTIKPPKPNQELACKAIAYSSASETCSETTIPGLTCGMGKSLLLMPKFIPDRHQITLHYVFRQMGNGFLY
jgi:hypothetical protein